jgi:hypothetical protein
VYLSTDPAAGGLLPDVATLILRGSDTDYMGTGLAFVGDADGDGVSDVLVGAKGRDGTGAAWLIPGNATGTSAPEDIATVSWSGQEEGDLAGEAATALGDATGDGLPDLAISAPALDGVASNGGMVAIVAAPAQGGDLTNADAAIYGDFGSAYLGGRLAGGMDLDGDGLGDLAAGAGATSQGMVAVFLGPFSGTSVLGNADAKLLGEDPGDGVHDSMAPGGDVDGDGLEDLLLGAPARDGYTGIAYLVRGTPAGQLDLFLADARLYGETPDSSVGDGLASLGDMDGDGFGDFLVGSSTDPSWGEVAGLVYLFYGPVSGSHPISEADATFTPAEPRAAMGRSLAFAGDATGDGLPDLWIGAEGASTGGYGSGAIYLVPGSGL